MAAKSSSRRLVELESLGGWGCGSSRGVMPSPKGYSGHHGMYVSDCRGGRLAPGPGCQGAVTAGEHLAQRTATWGGGSGGHQCQGKEASPQRTVAPLVLLPLTYASLFRPGCAIGWYVGGEVGGGGWMTLRSASLASPAGMALNLACWCLGLP